MRLLLLATLTLFIYSCTNNTEKDKSNLTPEKEDTEKELFYVYLDSFERTPNISSISDSSSNKETDTYKLRRYSYILDSITSTSRTKTSIESVAGGKHLILPINKIELVKDWKFHYENKKKSQLSENQGKHFIKIGNMSGVVRDTFVNNDFFANEMYDFMEFNYPKFHLNESGTPNSIYFSKNQDNNFQLSIKTQDFDSTAHSYIKDDNLIIMIDGKTSWGNAGSLPRNKIKEISFLINGKKTFTNSKHFSNLYEISLNEDGCNVHYTYDDKVIISFHGSYGMGSYRVFLFFDNEGEFLYKIVNLAG